MMCVALDCYQSVIDLVPYRPTFVGTVDLIRLMFVGALR